MYYEVNYKSISSLGVGNLFCNVHEEFIVVQRDSVDFTRTLFNDLFKENNRINNKPKYENFHSLKQYKNDIGIDCHELYLRTEDLFINDLFSVQLSNTYICTYGYEIYNFQKCSHIPIYIPINNRNYDFNYLIKYNFNETIKKNYVECPSSKRKILCIIKR